MKFNISEKIFSFFCDKNRKWGSVEKENLGAEKLLKIQKIEWDVFWDKLDESNVNFKDKIIVDYGCGYGFDSLFMLQEGAKHIYCLEIEQERLDISRKLHLSHGYNNATYIDNSNISELPNKIGIGKVDIIICRDVMEHIPSPYEALNSMYEILKHGSNAYIGFSPLYKSPYGSHFSGYCKIPWIHLIFSERTVLNVFKELYKISDTINSYQKIPGSGLNKLSYFKYLELLKKFNWYIEKNYINRFSNSGYLKDGINILVSILPFKSIKELFIVSVYTKMIKNNKILFSSLQ